MKNLAIVIVLTIGAFAISANIENQTKIGYVDEKAILDKMEIGKKMNSKIEESEREYKLKRDNLLAKLNANRNGNDSYYGSKNMALTNGASKQERGELQILEEVQDLDYKHKTIILAMKQKVLSEARATIDAVIKEVATEKGYKYVLNSDVDGENRAIIISNKGDDLTATVLDRLDIK